MMVEKNISFSGVINTFFQAIEFLKKEIITFFIAAICIDSMLNVDKESYPQVYLEQCKCKIKKRKLVDFIDAEVNYSSDDSDDSE